MLPIVIVTASTMVDQDYDQELLLASLAAHATEVRVVAWDSSEGDALLHAPRHLLILRSPWNYYRDLPKFLAWLARIDERHALHNPLAVVKQNVHKGYLLDLQQRGIEVVPTALVPKQSRTPLADVIAQYATDVVVKPATSAGSFQTRKVSAQDAAIHQVWFAEVLEAFDMLVQPYLPEVEDRGERSLIYIAGQLTHAIRKSPRFFGMKESTTLVEVSAEERDFGARVLHAASAESLLYARVDTIVSGEKLRLMELELVEPSLFLRESKFALDTLVQNIVKLAS